LKEVNHLFKHDKELGERIDLNLKEQGLSYEGSIKVRHFVDVLYNDYGLKEIEAKITNRLEGLKVAVHYGCHLLRPSEVTNFDEPYNPSIIDDLVEVTGATSVPWNLMLRCCGAPVLAVNEKVALKLIKDKLDSAKKAGAECIVTACPFCEIMFDLQQLELSQSYGLEYDLPALLYPQLLGLALGLTPDNLGLELNRIPTDKLLERFSR
jgi:heterodisulfide reductase subunit B